MKKKGGEDRDTKTYLIDDVYLQVCHVKKNNFNMPYAFHCLFTDLQGPEKKKHISLLCDLIIIFYQGILSENIS